MILLSTHLDPRSSEREWPSASDRTTTLEYPSHKMSPVEPNRHTEEVEEEEEGPEIEERKAEDEEDPIIQQHDALRLGMDKLLNRTSGLWQENLSLKNEVEFWKNEWRRTLGLRTQDLALRNEVEKWKIEKRRASSDQQENVSLKNQVEQLKSKSRMAEQAREELETKVGRLLRTAKLGRTGSNRRGDIAQQTYEKVKRERVEAEQERKSKGKDWRRKAMDQRKEEGLRRKAMKCLTKAKEVSKQRKAMDQRRKAREAEMKRKVDPRTGTKLKRKTRSSDRENDKKLEDEDPKAYKHSWQGELHRGRSSPKVGPFRSQLTHVDDDHITQQRGSGPTPSAPSTSSTEQDSEVEDEEILVPDPHFHDFDASRTEKDILPGQIWAVYDDQDGMPRLYARIFRVTTRPFKASVNWLNDCPKTKEEILWMKSTGHLITCGDFKMGRTFRVMDRINTFSHFVMDKVARGQQQIYPKKGQVWAVYKEPEQVIGPAGGREGSKLKYEVVEILSEFCDSEGLKTGKLVNVKGFLTVFHRQDGIESFRSFQPEELYKFSHRVPNHRIEDSQADAHGVPHGSLELDPASTPVDLMSDLP